MTVSRIFSQSSIVEHLIVEIDGIAVSVDDVLEIDITSDFFDFKVLGSMTFRDNLNISSGTHITLNNDNKIKITITDFSGKTLIRLFRVISMNVDFINEYFKQYTFELQDEISFILDNAYMSKGFTSTPVAAFQRYLTELRIPQILSMERRSLHVSDTSSSTTFVVPQNESVLSFFCGLLKQENIRIWQDFNGINVSTTSADTLVPSIGSAGDIEYSQNITDQDNAFRIHDLVINKSHTGQLNHNLPKRSVFRSGQFKTINNVTHNLVEYISHLVLNKTGNTGLQMTSGLKTSYQETSDIRLQDYELFDEYMLNDSITIATVGLWLTSVGESVRVSLRGHLLDSTSLTVGDKMDSGKYLVRKTRHKLIGGKMISKSDLVRMDNNSV